MRKSLFTILILVMIIQLQAQMDAGQLTFTAVFDDTYVMLDSIKIMNRTQGEDTMLVYPDTVLILDGLVGINNPQHNHQKTLSIYQNYPNPFRGETSFKVFLPEEDKLQIVVYNLLGQKLDSYQSKLKAGEHNFTFQPGNDSYYVITAVSSSGLESIKLHCLSSQSIGICKVKYDGNSYYKDNPTAVFDLNNFVFEIGDKLLYIGYTNSFAGQLESGILDSPESSSDYIFQFATNIPCPGTPTVSYEWQIYNTIQIFSQCWMKENLNVGTMIQGSQEMTDNGIIEKYCYNNEPDSCVKYGGLYQWDEIMQYVTQQGAQGICPPGWHLPTDEEWKVLEGEVDSMYGVGDSEWDIFGENRGYDAGMNLKTTSGWYQNSNGTNLYSYSGLPSGANDYNNGYFDDIGNFGYCWTSTQGEISSAVTRSLDYYSLQVSRNNIFKNYGFSVRCIRD